MKTIDVRHMIESKNPGYFDRLPRFIGSLIISFIERLIHMSTINQFLETHTNSYGIDFIDDVFDEFDFSYLVSSKDRQRIPSEGKLIIVANHPLGGLDGLAIIKAISQVRSDIKVVANDLLMNLENLHELFLPYDVYSKRPQRNEIEDIRASLQREEAVIFFPAAEVSRLTWQGIRDRQWLKGPVYFARKYQAPILPVHVKAKNSISFYLISLLNKRLSMLLLPHEILNKRNRPVGLRIGDPIPTQSLDNNVINADYQTKLLRKHVYRLGKKKSGIFKTEKTIIHPVDRKILKNELANSQLLTLTPDDKKIYLVNYKPGEHIVKEIARLREVTFRKVGEGTGAKMDFDQYDRFYKHLVIWDDDELEIVGSYRLCVCHDVIQEYGVSGLYNASLFHFSEQFTKMLENSVELGRSFIQQKYWRSNSLDHLWLGIGAFLSQRPDIKYLFGAVSISDNYSHAAKSMIIYYYKKWFEDTETWSRSKNRFMLTRQQIDDLEAMFTGISPEEDLKILKENLKVLGYSIPILFRKYTELCDPTGVKFLDFGVDADFANCVDGLIWLDLATLNPAKRKRYFRILSSKVEKILHTAELN